MPRFSIIIPFHAAADTIGSTLEGLLAQTFGDWEAICVNDRTPDNSAEIVASFAAADPRISLVHSPAPGPSAARNHGAKLAQAGLLAFCDADDLWEPSKLAQLDKAFADPEISGLFGQIEFFTNVPGDGRARSTVPQGALSIPALLAENPVCTMSNLTLRRQAFLKVGGLDPAAVHNEDLELLIRMVGEGYRIEGLDHLQLWYRTAPNGLSSNLAAMKQGRDHALRTAAAYGVRSTPEAEAVYMRYLARRALRLDSDLGEARAYAMAGLRESPRAFLLPARRGVATAFAVAVAPLLSRRVRHALFAH
ncbi:glycosyltransferase family 2 protein [Lutimaribacter marinistellae]|uniref:Glycosyltransferase family 2 protein n=1 Tax=Lutimaribacter marinistellae TaxID=1820329 RepID=A0ABV7TDR7_9RHOB